MNKLDEDELDYLTMFCGMLQDSCSVAEAKQYLEVMGASKKTIDKCLVAAAPWVNLNWDPLFDSEEPDFNY